ncbi:MAG: hypothetical protein AAF790_14380, partial [Planctomycetota bacterium]
CTAPPRLEHWRVVQNNTWRWIEKAELVDGQWRHADMTVPVNKATGRQVAGRDPADYLFCVEAPRAVIDAVDSGSHDVCVVREGTSLGPSPIAERKAREGRPPSRWLRGLDAPQLRVWLATFVPPQADVVGMTFLEHLTRDHGFATDAVAGLTPDEQAKLHGAAHAGY